MLLKLMILGGLKFNAAHIKSQISTLLSQASSISSALLASSNYHYIR